MANLNTILEEIKSIDKKNLFLDYIVERITLQDALPLVLRLLVLYSLVNGGLRDKDFDTVRKEVIQVWKND